MPKDNKDLINNYTTPDVEDQNDVINNNHGESPNEYADFVCEEINDLEENR